LSFRYDDTYHCIDEPTIDLTISLLYRLGGDIVTVLVGPRATATRFFVHEDLVSQHSDFFQARLKEGWRRAEERIVRLPAASADAFMEFHSFLYTGKVYSIAEEESSKHKYKGEWARLESCWLLGNALLSTSFKDAVVDSILHRMVSTKSSPVGMCFSLHRHSLAGSPIRRLMIDIAVEDFSERYLAEKCSDVDMSFFQDLSVSLLKWKRQPRTARSDDPRRKEGSCFYHEHGDKPCYKKMF